MYNVADQMHENNSDIQMLAESLPQYRPVIRNIGCMKVCMYEMEKQSPGEATLCYY